MTAGSLASGDSLSGSLSRVPGQSVGTYDITQGALSAGANYELTFVAGELSITPKPITVTADDKSKVYGQSDPALTYSVTSGSLEPGDSLSGSLTRDPGEDVGTYDITQGALSAGANYDLTFVAGELSITPKPITVTADDKSKVYGSADPAFTYEVTVGSLEPGDSLSGSLTREPGQDVGTYDIRRGALSAGSNYDLTFVPGELSITPKRITVTADDKTKVEGDPDPAFTWSVSDGDLGSDDDLPGLSCTVNGSRCNGGSYDIECGGSTNGNYDVTYEKGHLQVEPRPPR